MAQADRASATPGFQPLVWSQRHAQEALSSLGRLVRRPLASLLTGLVIGITLALPASLQALLKNLQVVGYSWEKSFTASVFLKDDTSEAQGRELAEQFGKLAGTDGQYYVSREEALSEFRSLSGFAEALELLEDNPLPAVIVVWIHPSLDKQQVRELLSQLRDSALVDQVKMDSLWLERLQALMAFGSRATLILSLLLSLAVILIIGNTIRLDIQSRREEIVVMKLVGATDAFVRRPFLYTGFWYGFWGGLLAIVCVQIALLALGEPVQRLAGLYDSSYTLQGLGALNSLLLLFASVGMGWLGSLLTVAQHLQEIEPR